VKGFRVNDNFVVIDGTHTVCAAMLEGQKLIWIRTSGYNVCDESKYFSFEELKHHK
jgi:hypothetical protein